jgi:hypothetical protein
MLSAAHEATGLFPEKTVAVRVSAKSAQSAELLGWPVRVVIDRSVLRFGCSQANGNPTDLDFPETGLKSCTADALPIGGDNTARAEGG